MENKWVQIGSDYHVREVGNELESLPVAIYALERNPMTGQLYLTKMEDKFSLPSKIYGVERSFIDRVKKTYSNTDGNLGVLMSGVKGTGKSITAKQICNELGLPVVVIKERFTSTPDFINALQDNAVVFFDEYEKMYDGSDHSILTVMDGVLTTEYRKVFLLTTNSTYVNENMLQRPGRIRYHKKFEDMNAAAIVEVVDDLLVKKERREEIISFISNLEMITIDIVTSVVIEVNIHDESPSIFKDVFNVEVLDDAFDIFTIKDGKEKLLYSRVDMDPIRASQSAIGGHFRVNNRILGKIVGIVKDRGFKVESMGEPKKLNILNQGEEDDDDDYEDETCPAVEESGETKRVITTYLFERNSGLHQAFLGYAF